MKKKIIFFSITSDIAYYLANRLDDENYKIIGTYRNFSKKIKKFKNIYKLDISKKGSIDNFIVKNKKILNKWNILVISVGSQLPLGLFKDINFAEWERSFYLNYIKQMEIIHKMLVLKGKKSTIITWAGPAVNNANKFYSAYTLSKISLIKSMELLDYEIKDSKFVILGPGWVKTKIHNDTIKNKEIVKKNYILTKKILDSNSSRLTPLENIYNCFNWVINSNKKIVGGRNFSVKFDDWGSKILEKKLLKDFNYYKLRRQS